MPWRGPSFEGEFPTLGWQVAEYIEANVAIPDGERMGEAYILTDDQLQIVLNHYRLDPATGRFVHFRGTQYVGPQKVGKGPFGSAVIIAEADGPVLFDGWDANGDPVGKQWATPWVQVAASSEDQTDNVWLCLLPMIELGAVHADISDTGDTRINLRGGGKIEPVTSSGRARLGQRITFALQDETHSWLERNGGRKLADTQRRNLAGTKGRWLETTNAWDPIEQSVAQATFEGAAPGTYKFMRSPGAGSVRNKRDRLRMMREVYGSHTIERGGWIDLERIDGEIVALLDQGDAAQAERYFLNRAHAGEGAAFDMINWGLRKAPLETIKRDLNERRLVVLGIDGARWDDSLAVIATDVDDGFQWTVGIWETPEDALPSYVHPLAEVKQAIREVCELHTVPLAYIDPQYIESLVDDLQAEFGQKVFVPWYTSKTRAMCHAVRNYVVAVNQGDMCHDGNDVMTTHVGQARRRKTAVLDDLGKPMFDLSKDRTMSPRKIDAAIAGVLSWEARGDAIAAGYELNVDLASQIW